MSKHLEVLIHSDRIQEKITDLAKNINQDFQNLKSEPVVLCCLNGAFMFCADLVRKLDISFKMEFIQLSSYKMNQSNENGVDIHFSPLQKDGLRGRTVLVIEDIIDTGKTYEVLTEFLFEKYHVADIKLASLLKKKFTTLEKQERKIKDTSIDYLGFEVPNVFIVGMGLDCSGMHRNLPFVASVI